jgi:hypothetical protein
MASSSIYLGDDDNTIFEVEVEFQELVFDCGIPKCKGVPCELWTIRCISLYNDNRLGVIEGICHSVKSNLIIGSTRLFGDTHVVVQISKSLNADEFPEHQKYSVRSWPIPHVFYSSARLFNHERRHKFNC